jgi:hypothetical protein
MRRLKLVKGCKCRIEEEEEECVYIERNKRYETSSHKFLNRTSFKSAVSIVMVIEAAKPKPNKPVKFEA